MEDIADVRGEIGKTSLLGVTDNSWLVVVPEKGEEWRLQFASAAMGMWDFNMMQMQSASKVSNWVSSIKLELQKLAIVRQQHGAVSDGGKFCRFCGAENKTDADFCEKCGKNIG